MLDVRSLSIRFGGRPVVEDMSFRIERGETLGIVGESGSGKSLMALAAIGLLPRGARADGQVLFDGRNLLDLPESELCALRGRRIGMVFQEPMSALNPSMRVGAQIAEGLRLQHAMTRQEARAEALRLLERVRIPEAARRIDAYPHELSGGQRQRVGIAIALAPRPELLIADEPTTALDLTVQREILDLLAELVDELDLALILISHDLSVIARMAERTLVMFRGRRIEEGETETLLRHPRSEHAQALIAALPRRLRQALEAGEAEE